MIGGVAVAVVAALAIGMAAADDDPDGATSLPSWDSIAVVDRESGAVSFLDRDGNATGDEIDTGIEAVRFVVGEGEQLALAGDAAAAVVDVAASTVEAPALPDGAFASRLGTSEPLVLAAAQPEGGDVTLVSATTSVDVAELAALDDPLFFAGSIRADLAGTLFAVGDSRSVQTAIVRPDGASAVLVPGVPLGLTEEIAVTVEAEAPGSTVHFSTPEGDQVSSVDGPFVIGGLVTGDGEAVIVSESGEVLLASSTDEEMQNVTTLELDGDVRGSFAALHGQRLLVVADRGIAVLDDQGEVITTVQLDDEWRPHFLISSPWQRCAVIVSERGTATMLDVETGETLGSVDDVAIVNTWSTDGCTASLLRSADETALLRDGVEVPLEAEERVVAIAPTGDLAVVRDRTGEAWLRNLDDDDADAVSLGRDREALYAFVDR